MQKVTDILVSARYGAPMGRESHPFPDGFDRKVYVYLVEMVDGDYDRGGAYWGGSSPLYAAQDFVGEYFETYRAKSAADLVARLRKRGLAVASMPAAEMVRVFKRALEFVVTVCAVDESEEHADDLRREGVKIVYSRDLNAKLARLARECLNACAADGATNPEAVGHDFALTLTACGVGLDDRFKAEDLPAVFALAEANRYALEQCYGDLSPRRARLYISG